MVLVRVIDAVTVFDLDRRVRDIETLSQDLLEGGGEVLLTEMGDDELLKLVALDLHAASEE